MKKFTQFKSNVIPLNMNDVDTDMIIPAQYLTQVSKSGYGEYLFENLKVNDPQFVFNNPKYKNAKILLSKDNFGCGSSREHAVWALQQAGIDVVIAESFSDIFFNNSAKNGLLLIMLSKKEINILMTQAELSLTDLIIDLENQIVSDKNEKKYHFEYDAFRKECLIKGQDDLDYLLEATKAT
jgi:3-isopropylmalate/(R)-2-methylmalate dehydratase small subunit